MFNWMELSKGCTKGLLLALNLICILIALTTFGFAVADTRILKQYGEQQAEGSFVADMIIILVCLLLLVVALFGCVAVVKDNVVMLYLRAEINANANFHSSQYAVFIMTLVILELMIAIYVSIQRYGLQFRVSEYLREDFFNNVTAVERQAHDKMWDDLQTGYECCGLNSPEDYAAIGRPISLSCCSRAYRARTAVAQQNMYKACIESATHYSDGCEDKILYILAADADWLLGVAVMSFWFEALGILLAMWVANHVKNCVHVYKHTVKY